MGTQTVSTDNEFSSLQFEKILTGLKDSQESINSCCHWCLNNRQHYKKIVNVWLNVIKRVKIEQRLTLFYLANDVVQYSKRRNYDYVETWGTAIQKATTLVRDDKVKNKILRIFKIWEQRGVYGEEFIADLCGLISIQPTGPKNDEPHEFQPSYVINKIKNCSNLEKDTDTKLKVLKEHNPKIQISEGLINSLKDRANTDDVEKEVDVYVQHMENYINALKLEIKNRIALITVLKQAETQLESDRKDVKMVAHAYRTFGQRVKGFQKKLEEHMERLPSPIPSPDINAPSPSPEEDLELPDDTPTNITSNNSADNSLDFSATIQYANPGFYVPPPVTSVISTMNSTMNNTTTSHNTSAASDNISFLSNGFTSFLGSNLSFDVSNISATGIFPNSITEHSTADNTQTTNSYVTTPTPVLQPPMSILPGLDLNMDNNSSAVYNPLLPPPMPPFSKNNDTGAFSFTSNMEMNANNSYAPTYEPPSYSEATYSTETGMNNSGMTDPNHYEYQIQTGINPYPPSEEKYDPSQVTDTWDNVENPPWDDMNNADTPESPPMFEKEGYGDPVEYHDTSLRSGAVDVDQRVIPGMGDLDILEDSLSSLGGKDVDHRNLISLTGSPNVDNLQNGINPPNPLPARGNLKTITTQDSLWDNLDRDYRNLMATNPSPPVEKPPPLPAAIENVNADQDYRLQFGLDGLTLPPPPPPPPKSPQIDEMPPPPLPPPPALSPVAPPPVPSADPRTRSTKSPKNRDLTITEDVDMDLSDDVEQTQGGFEDESHLSLEPPPPLPDLLDDVDANQFLDEISNDLNEFSNLSSELNVPENEAGEGGENGMHHMDEHMDHPGDMDQGMWGPPLGPPPMGFGMGPPMGMGPPGLPPPPGYVTGMNRMDMMPPRPPGLLPTPGPPMPPMPQPPNWMDGQPPSWMPQNNMPPPFEDNPYLHDEGSVEFDDNGGFVDFRNNRGGHNNFRGGFNNSFNEFNKNDNFQGFRGGRGRGRGGGNRGGGRGNNRGGRGKKSFRSRGNFRGGFNRGGF